MAYHHDPRYGPSPYPFQQQFHAPQPQLHQHNYGMPHPVGPAPPQSYLPPRNPMFPGQMAPHPHMNMHQRTGPEFPGAHAYDPAFQHNSQYNPAFPGPNPPPPPPGIHSHSSPFQNMPFQPPAANASGSMQTNQRPLLIPPPPPGMQQHPQQSAGSPGSATWPQNHGLPPKPPAIGFNEPVQLSGGQSHHLSNQNSGNSGDKSQGFSSSGSHLPSHNIDLTPMNQNPEAKRPPPLSQQQQQKQQYQAHNSQRLSGQSNSAPITSQAVSTFATGAPSRPSQKDDRSKQPVIIDLSQSQNEKVRTPEVLASPSPDIYSPQSHAEGLPGLGSMDDISSNMHRSIRKEADRHEHVTEPTSARLRLVKPSDRPVPLDPFAIKRDALSAIKDLDAQKINFTEIAAEGIDAQVLERLYSELGIKHNNRKPEPPPQVVEKLVATKDVPQQPQQDKPGQLEKKSTTPLQPPKAMPREDYIAKLRAAKGGKPVAKEKTEGDVQDNPVVLVDGSDSGNELTQALPQKLVGVQKKSTDPKVLTTTDKVRQRLEALKKTMGEKQKQVGQATHTGYVTETRSSGEYTPANPFFSAEAATTGIPGLSMSDEPEPNQVENEVLEESVNAAGKRAGDPSIESSEARKRVRQQSMSSYQEVVRPSTSSGAHQVVIELSDDEEEGEVSETLIRPTMQRHFSDGIAYHDASLQKQSNQAQPPQQSHRDDLAAREKEIRLFRQRIAELEAKAKAKKAVAYSTVTPASGTTSGLATQNDKNTPSVASTSKPVLSTMSERVEAQQQSLVAAKAAIEDRLEKEKEAYASANQSDRLTTALNGQVSGERGRHQEKILALKQSLEKVNTQILQTETELSKVRKLEEDLQRQLQRGIKNRNSFNNELRILMNVMAIEDARSESPDPQEPALIEALADDAAEIKRIEAYNSSPEAGEDKIRIDASEDDLPDSKSVSQGADETMDISDVDEGEISDSEHDERAPQSHHSSPGEKLLPDTQQSSPGTETSSLYKDHSVDENLEEQADIRLAENNEPTMEVEDDYEPQSDKESSDSEQMDYEPDYEPEPDPGALQSDSSDANEYEPPGEYVASQSEHESPASPHSEEGEIIEDSVQLENENSEQFSGSREDSVMGEAAEQRDPPGEHDSSDEAMFGTTMLSDRVASDDLPGLGSDDDDDDDDDHDKQEADEGADADSNDDDDEEEGEDEEEEEGEEEEYTMGGSVEAKPTVNVDTDANASVDSDADSVVYADDVRAEADAEDADEEDDDDAAAFQANNSMGFTPYESPLQMFKAYRYHPDHRIDANKQLCPRDLRCETCNEAACPYQHFGQLKLSDNNLKLELGSVPRCQTAEEKDQYVSGMRALLKDIRDRGILGDINAVAKELTAYRSRFLGASPCD